MDIEDAFADMTEPPPGTNTDFVFLRAPGRLSAYLIEHKALAAFPLLVAVQRRLDVLKKRRAPLSVKVWRDAGDPPKGVRATMLAHLRRVPELVLLHDDRHFKYRYSVEKGPAWRAIEKAAIRQPPDDEEDAEE